ncbi:hypothetical protein J3R30DRAFT_3560051 [Lentinula aciculospora]|uniref:Uncharacterized protein n=1 Tax=Lentinula aciculospora TaxID=153920 RepID=A0A9W8ZVN1_9AGAR|nr:hypothetical protein J3R30DRAFT_3560051 [Lentinula aciculospora]
MNALDLLPHHTLLGSFDNLDEEPDDQIDDRFESGLGNEENGEAHEMNEKEEQDWAPHGLKTMFMLDLLDKQPHQHLSDPQSKSILWVMRECGCKDVPTFAQLRKKQTVIVHQLDIPSKC